MALPSSGGIKFSDITTEFGLGIAPKKLLVRTLNGIRQTYINDTWVNCNMCSPNLPTDVAPHQVTHWYGYNHSALGIANIDITGTFTITANTNYTYNAVLTGGNVGGTITWEKHENGVWSNIGTGASKVASWATVAGAKIKATITGNCNGSVKSVEKNINLSCIALSNASISWNGGGSSNLNLDYGTNTVINLTYSGDTGTVVWTVNSAGGSIVSGQGTNQLTVTNTPSLSNNTSLEIYATITNPCGNITTGTLYISTKTYGNQVQSGAATRNNCGANEVGTQVTYTVSANTYTEFTQADANQLAINDVNANKQTYANTNGSCNTTQIGNQFQSDYFQKSGCVANPNGDLSVLYAGSDVQISVNANTYYANTQAAANQLAINYINANGQTNANNNGSCELKLSISTNYYYGAWEGNPNGVGYRYMINYSFNVYSKYNTTSKQFIFGSNSNGSPTSVVGSYFLYSTTQNSGVITSQPTQGYQFDCTFEDNTGVLGGSLMGLVSISNPNIVIPDYPIIS